MDNISIYVGSVVAAIIIAEMLMAIMPDGAMKGYAKLAAGILIMTMLVAPLAQCVGSGAEISSIWNENMPDEYTEQKTYSDIIFDVYTSGAENNNTMG